MEDRVTSEDGLIKLVRMFETAEEATYEERARNERDRDYYDGKQLTTKERQDLEDKKQPPVIYNRIRRKINFMLGMEKQTRKDPKGFPRTPDDEDAAEAVTDGLRYVCDDNDWDEKRSLAWENMLVEGTGAILVGAKTDKTGITPMLAWVPWDRFFYDQHSRRHDYSDATFMGIVTWFDQDEAEQRWPDAKESIQATLRTAWSETFDDRPRWKTWADTKRRRVRVIELYYVEQGKWMRCLFTEKGHLEEPQISPYLDEDGEPECPIKAVSLYIDRDNNRYGDVRDMIDPQDEINKRRSKGLHLISMRQARVGSNAVMEPERIRKELAKPDGIIQGDDVEILVTTDMAAQNLQLLQEAKAEIDLQGANASLQGKNENDMSGRAILAQQQGGMIEVALHLDRLRHLTLQVYEALWNRIRQYWTDERWIRVTDDDRNLKFVGINQPVTAADKLKEQIEASPEAQQALQTDPAAQARAMMFLSSPAAQQVVEVRNTPSEIDIDIVIDEGMDTPTIQAEQWQELVKLMPTLGQLAQRPEVLEILISSSQLRDKDKLLEMVERLNEPNPMQDQAQQITMAKEVAGVKETESKAKLNTAKAEDTRSQTQLDAFKAGVEAAV